MKTLRKFIALLLILLVIYPGNPVILAAAADNDLSAPTEFRAAAYSTHIQVTWKNNKNNENIYYYTVIEKKVDQGDFYPVATLYKGTESYKDYGISNGHIYTYRAYTYYLNRKSPYTDEAEVIIFYPTNLTVSQKYSNYVDLEWEYPPLYGADAPANKILIERRQKGSSKWYLMATLPVSENSWRDTTVKAGTLYYYRIRAQYTNGNESYNIPYDSGISTRTAYPLTTSLTGYAISDTAIRLEWDISDKDATYILEKKNIAGDFSVILDTRNLSSYVDDYLVKGKTYTYRLRMRSSKGVSSEYTEEIDITAETVSAPWDLSVFALASGGTAITWNYPYEVETGFEVWRKGPEKWDLIATLPRNTDTYIDTNVEDGQNYQYKVRAIRGETAFSAFTKAEPVSLEYPPKPGDPAYIISDGILFIYSTDDVPSGITYTLEYREDFNSEWKDFKTVSKGTLIAFINYSPWSQYYFRIRANKGTLSTYSSEIHFYGTVPEKPRSFKAALNGYDRVVLTWEDMSSTEEGYYIYRTANNGSRQLLAYVGKDAESYVDTSPIPGSTSRYEITAFNTAGETASIAAVVTIPKASLFYDIASYKWANDAIYALLGRDAFQWNNGYFRPNATITKGEAVRWILRSFDITYQKKGLFTVSDLSPSHTYYQDLATAITIGMIFPDRLDRIYPDKIMTRRDIVLLINEALNYKGISLYSYSSDALNAFGDRDTVSPGEAHIIASFVYNEIISGKQGRRLALQDPVTRAECAAIIYRTLQKYGID